MIRAKVFCFRSCEDAPTPPSAVEIMQRLGCKERPHWNPRQSSADLGPSETLVAYYIYPPEVRLPGATHYFGLFEINGNEELPLDSGIAYSLESGTGDDVGTMCITACSNKMGFFRIVVQDLKAEQGFIEAGKKPKIPV